MCSEVVAFAEHLSFMSSGNIVALDVLDADCTRFSVRQDFGRGNDLIVYAPDAVCALCAAWDLFMVGATGAWRVYDAERDRAGLPLKWETVQVGQPRLAAFAEGMVLDVEKRNFVSALMKCDNIAHTM